MYVDILISNVFNLNLKKSFLFLSFTGNRHLEPSTENTGGYFLKYIFSNLEKILILI